MTLKAKQEIENAEVIVGYKKYVDLVRPLISKDAEIIVSEMGQEIERAEIAIIKALENKRVAFVSGGDPGVYGAAGLVLEVAGNKKADIDIEIVPGVTSATAAASSLGAPLMVDFAVISLSDILTPWELIERRLRAAVDADFVIVLYNPQSEERKEPLLKTHKILLEYRNPKTLVGIVRRAKRHGEEIIITTLGEMLNYKIDMVTTIIIGNSTTYLSNNRLITPRGYIF
ncbi:MAG: precorrin-3B C(17)-methyltransferase [Nitrososphaerales archaeon]